MKIIIKPNNTKARVGLRNWASISIADYEITLEEKPFRVIATPLGRIRTCFAGKDVETTMTPNSLPKKLQAGMTKFAGMTFSKILETFFRSSIQKSQRLSKKDIEVTVSNE